MQVIRHGKYKSAVEPFLRNNISEENKTQLAQLLESIWHTMSREIATSRNIEVSRVHDWADHGVGAFTEGALKSKMVDSLVYQFDYDTEYGHHFRKMSLADYIRTGKGTLKVKYSIRDKVAVVHAQGSIMYGRGDQNQIGQELLLETFEDLQSNHKVKAVVLRVNSPGGSALASDLIWSGIERLKKKKPVVVSMGSYAASGGYYIACNADHIVAEPTTITGSIGVFSLLPNVEKLADKVGIHTTTIRTNKGPYYSMFDKINPFYEKHAVQSVRKVYDTFVSKVARGRHMSRKAVHKVAQGRVWSGVQALKRGLVDQLGNLDTAVEKAAQLAHLERYKIVHYPHYEKNYEELFKKISQISQPPFIKLMPDSLRDFLTLVSNHKSAMVQARLPFVMKMR